MVRLLGSTSKTFPRIAPPSTSVKRHGQLHDFLKTEKSKREIDLHPTVAATLRDFIGEGRRDGLLFASRTGKPLSQSNVLRRWLHPILAILNQPKRGAHAFRRFRLTHIRKRGVPKDLERFWMGHDDEEIGDIYSKLKEDVEFRQSWTKRYKNLSAASGVAWEGTRHLSPP